MTDLTNLRADLREAAERASGPRPLMFGAAYITVGCGAIFALLDHLDKVEAELTDAYQRGIREGMERAAGIADRYAEQNRDASTKASTRAKKFKRLGDIFGHGEMAESAVWELDACAHEARAIAFAIRESKEEPNAPRKKPSA